MAAELVVLELNLSDDVVDLATTTQAQIRSQVKGAIVGVGVVEEVQIFKGDDSAIVKILLSRVLAKGQTLIDALGKNENKTINIFGKEVPLSLGDSVQKGSGGGASTRGLKKKEAPAPVVEEGGKGGKGGGRGGKGGAGGKGGRGGGKGGGKGGRRSNICYDFQKGACERDDCRFSHNLDEAENDEEPRAPRRGKGGRRGGGSQICFDFKNGRCERDDCRFSHDLEAAAAEEAAAPPRRSRGICFQFQEGTCDRDNCRFSHNLADAEANAAPRQSRPKPVCFDFQQGKCQRDNCRFSHEAQEAVDGAVDDGEGEWSQPAQSSGRGRGRGGGRGRGRGRGGGGSRVCYDFQKGNCARDNCKFSHEAQAAENAGEDA